MKLAIWRKNQGMTQAQLAEALGCSQSYISQIERASAPVVPGPAVAVAIYQLTAGAVQPNDFYELPTTPRKVAA